MRIVHIDLSRHLSAAEEQLVLLIETLSSNGVEQHAMVRNPLLARRLGACNDVSLGPIVRSAIGTPFLFPGADLVHVHDKDALNAGVLLSFARRTPFVVTFRRFVPPGIATRWKYRRAARIVCPSADITHTVADCLGRESIETVGDARHPDNLFEAPENLLSTEAMAAAYLGIYHRILERENASAD